jgi:hypothetical protein
MKDPMSIREVRRYEAYHKKKEGEVRREEKKLHDKADCHRLWQQTLDGLVFSLKNSGLTDDQYFCLDTSGQPVAVLEFLPRGVIGIIKRRGGESVDEVDRNKERKMAHISFPGGLSIVSLSDVLRRPCLRCSEMAIVVRHDTASEINGHLFCGRSEDLLCFRCGAYSIGSFISPPRR